MRKTLIIAAISIVTVCMLLTLAIGGFLIIGRQGDNSTQASKQYAEIYTGLRTRALETSPASMGLTLDPKSQEPYGILMDMSLSEGIATLVSFSTGDASIYFSNGGGIIGGIGHESVRNASIRFVSLAKQYTGKMRTTKTCPVPSAGRVFFYVVTPQGILTAEADEKDLGEKRSELSPLFYAGQDVITQLRLVTEKNPSSK